MDKTTFCNEVETMCELYGFVDGGDLCYNLIDMGVINMTEGVSNAARIVAQHVLQA